MEKKGYNAAFVYTRAAGGYEGVVTWTTFESKEAFDAWYTEKIKRAQRVVEEGISKERALQLTARTPAACRIAAAHEAAKTPSGKTNPFVLRVELNKAHFAIALDAESDDDEKK